MTISSLIFTSTVSNVSSSNCKRNHSSNPSTLFRSSSRRRRLCRYHRQSSSGDRHQKRWYINSPIRQRHRDVTRQPSLPLTPPFGHRMPLRRR